MTYFIFLKSLRSLDELAAMARATVGGEAVAEWGGVRSSGGGGGFGGGGGRSGRGGDESRGAHGRKFIGEGDNMGREGETYHSEVEVRSNEEGGITGVMRFQ
jgi:hypothetical protein